MWVESMAIGHVKMNATGAFIVITVHRLTDRPIGQVANVRQNFSDWNKKKFGYRLLQLAMLSEARWSHLYNYGRIDARSAIDFELSRLTQKIRQFSEN